MGFCWLSPAPRPFLRIWELSVGGDADSGSGSMTLLTVGQSRSAVMAVFCVSVPAHRGRRWTSVPGWVVRPSPLTFSQYIGQAAYISQDPSAYSNPFYTTVPPGMFYPSLVFAIAAAIVASQTMITATFQVRLPDRRRFTD